MPSGEEEGATSGVAWHARGVGGCRGLLGEGRGYSGEVGEPRGALR